MSIDPKDVSPDLEQRHRDAMLDLVLAWGSARPAHGAGSPRTKASRSSTW
jgi:hypothetical protein